MDSSTNQHNSLSEACTPFGGHQKGNGEGVYLCETVAADVRHVDLLFHKSPRYGGVCKIGRGSVSAKSGCAKSWRDHERRF